MPQTAENGGEATKTAVAGAGAAAPRRQAWAMTQRAAAVQSTKAKTAAQSTTAKSDVHSATGDPGTGAQASTVVVEAASETRIVEGALIFIGALVLVFAGFVAASWPRSFGSATSTAMTSVGPVTQVSATQIGSTITQVTTSAITTTSSQTASQTTSDTWLGVVLGVGALIVLAGAFYRRATSLEGFGFKIGLTGVIGDATRAEALKAVNKNKSIPPEQKPLVYERVLEKAAKAQVKVKKAPTKPAPHGLEERFKRAVSRTPKNEIIVDAQERPIAPATIDGWVDEAKDEVARTWGAT